ncbi:hypothetical protein GGR51DRAFT_558043 [Nemania sp. FL0031]|nr:hypothetical protein GGR51DRAFT_558043 [Nemania sp. FL0031]
MTNLGPLTTTFTPIGPDCTSTFLGFNQHNAWVQYGAGGDASVACLPSGFVPSYSSFYSPGICPSGYTKACFTQPFATTVISRLETRITCCPSSFQCNDRPTDDPFACISYFSKETFDVSVFTFLTNLAGSTTALVGGTTSTVWSDNFILAYGPIVHIAEGDIAPATTTTVSSSSFSHSYSSTTATPTPADSTNSSPRLSQGAVAGIVIGALLAGVFLIGTLALFLRRRRRRRLSEANPRVTVPEMDAQVKLHQGSLYPHNNGQQQQKYLHELHSRSEPAQVYELNATGM